MMKSFNDRVYEIIIHIPRGMVMSYGQIARLAGNSMASRAVGYALHNIPNPEHMPWHRVVFKDGALPCFRSGKDLQMKLLRTEKVAFTLDGKVDMAIHRWDGTEVEALFF